MTEVNLSPTPEQPPRKRRALVAGLVAVLAIVAVPLLASLGGDGSSRGDRHVTDDEALTAVRAAVGKTVASGGWDSTFETSSTHPTTGMPSPCPPGASCRSTPSTSTFESRGHGTVSFDPFVSRVETETSYGPRILIVTSTTVWLSGPGAPVGTSSGIPLSSFAGSVQGALGPSLGALAMISLASPGGALNLEQEAVADAAPAGTGTVDGVNVTYYDVKIDMSKLADAPDLSDVQRATIEAALPLLRAGGYTGTTERIGVDDAGYIREVIATNHFEDGSTGTRHTVLSNFGCAAKQYPPNQTPSEPETPEPCAPPTPTTTAPASPTTLAPAVAPTSTLPPTTTSTTPSTTTTLPVTSTTLAP